MWVVSDVSILLAILAAVIPPCPTEDYTATVCYWDASQQGSVTGMDFLNISENSFVSFTDQGEVYIP